MVSVNRGRSPRRRSNPFRGQFSFQALWPGLAPAILGRIWLAFAVRQWGGDWGTSIAGAPAAGGTPPPPSPFAGQQWGFQGYFVGVIAAWAGAHVAERFRPGWGFHFWRGAVENMAARLVWTEGIARSEWGQKHFGQMAVGQVADDGRGNRMVLTPQGWQYMMGNPNMGELQERPLDGLQPARALDGLVRERALDAKSRGVGGRRFRPMGHAMPEGTEDKEARYHGSGANTAYHSAYQRAY